ncbi:extracellular calcium-sensing receptor-like [Spea bombifrons]|uniref:extracellular calcium-sensing receptor-like n=1 Tax=Spea bombifrons TaxID=233779 RepID=UPI0023497902|nr:extracellular calcium-sensing receptor-like [Spea bombifrons]
MGINASKMCRGVFQSFFKKRSLIQLTMKFPKPPNGLRGPVGCVGTGLLYKSSMSDASRKTKDVLSVIWQIFLSQLIHAFYSKEHPCSLHVPELTGMIQPGDVMIGVLLPLHLDRVHRDDFLTDRPPRTTCTMFHFESYQQLQAMRYAVEEINANPNILPNVTLGFQAYDSCDNMKLDLGGALQVLTGYDRVIPNYRCLRHVPLSSIIGPAISTHSILLAHILGVYNYPQISHFSTSSLLSDRTQFPSFFRTVPSDTFQSKGLAYLVLHLGWTWIGLLAADTDYGQQGIQLVRQELIKAGACVAFSENILTNHPDRNAHHIVKVMKASSATVVVVYATDVDLFPVLDEMLRQNVTQKTLVASEAWSTSTLDPQGRFSTLLSGTIGLALHSGTIPGLREFLNKIHPSMSLGRNWLLYYMNKVRVTLSSGPEIYFDKNGDPPAVYDIVNWQLSSNGAIRYVKVGRYDTSSAQIFSINTSAVLWKSGNQQVPTSVCSQSCPPGFWKVVRRGEPVCCFQCLPCPQGEISNRTDSIDCIKCPWDTWPNPQKSVCLPKPIEYLSYEDPLGRTLASTSIISSLVPYFTLKLFIRFRMTPIVKANNYSLSCLLLVSLSFCFLCSLAFIGYPQPEKCLLRQVAFGMVFTLCISCILAKTIMVVFAFMATKPGSALKKWTSSLVSYLIISTCSFLQFILCVTWLSTAPPFPEQDLESQPRVIILGCNEGSLTAFWCMLGYLGLLAFISFIVAFLARRLPDNFNEAKFITFSMLAFLSVWVSFIPASLSAEGRYTVAMEVFAILASSWALLVCMFAPKCFIILFRPRMNSRENIIKKFQSPVG